MTDRYGGERLAPFALRPGDIAVADTGYGDRASVAAAAAQRADVVLRITPATFPLETAAEQPFDVLAWRRVASGSAREWHGWCRGERQRYGVRRLATRLSPAAAEAARRRVRRQAQKKGRTPSPTALWLAAWLLVVTTLAAVDWLAAAVLRLYRARWQVERVCKRMQQLLRLNQLRRTHPSSVEATIRALLVAWVLQAGRMSALRAHLPPGTPTTPRAVSSWGVVGLGLETLRQQVQGTWSQTRLRACLPRWRRCLVVPPRRREHQETVVRAWRKGRPSAQFDDQPEAA